MKGNTGVSGRRSHYTSKLLAFIRDTIFKYLPSNAVITRIEFEGPEIAVYVKNPEAVIEQSGLIRSIAKAIKKRIVIRTDPSIRKMREQVVEIIKSLVPPDAGITDIRFDEVLGEAVVKAKNPRLVIGRDGVLLKRLTIETGWRIRIENEPPIPSRIVEGVLTEMLMRSDERRDILRRVGERIHRDIIFENNFVRITALGAFREVGRSAILVETAESRVLLDLGLNPGGTSPQTLYPRIDIEALRPDTLDAVVVSHAHLDHCGLVPLLYKYGYEGPVYTTAATRDLMILVQNDYLDVSLREGSWAPYSLKEVRKMILHTIALDYEEVTDIAPDIRLTLYNAGHILGSAMIHLHIGRGLHNILYTSDFKYAKTRLLNRAHDVFPRVETLVMESTYGATEQRPREESEKELIDVIKKTIESGGKVLIPVMAVGRAQEIMIIIEDAIRKGFLPEVDVYIDGLLHEATAIHAKHYNLLASDIAGRIARHDNENPFLASFFKRVKTKEEREEIVHGPPSVILATSGMLTGGPSVEYFKMMAHDPRNALVFVSYQVKGTLGRRVKDGAREIKMMGEEGKVEILKINMQVYSIEGFSGHSDKRELLNFLARMHPKPRRIILNHGEPEAIEELARSIRRNKIRLGLPIGTEVLYPSILDSIKLT